MDQGDPEQRIAELERQLAEQKHVEGPEQPAGRSVVTAEDVHNVSFSESARGRGGYREKPGYNENEVDRFLMRVEATLRDPAAPGAVTPADIRNVTFSGPPIGKHGYDQDEVDAFLSRVAEQLTSQQGELPPVTESDQPTRVMLYPVGGWNPGTPLLAVEVGEDAIQVIDPDSNALVASVPLAQMTAKPAQHGGIPVLVVDGPGLETMSIRPPGPGSGQWRRWPKTRKPDYLALDEDWLLLAEKFGLASDVVEEFTPQTLRDHIGGFIQEFGPHKPLTWRTLVAYGLVCGVVGCVLWIPVFIVTSVILFVMAALARHFGWGFGPNLLVLGAIVVILGPLRSYLGWDL
jgi:DivIVA domain-containing protein